MRRSSQLPAASSPRAAIRIAAGWPPFLCTGLRDGFSWFTGSRRFVRCSTRLLTADAALRAWLVTHHAPWLDQVHVAAVGRWASAGPIWIAIAAVMASWVPRLRAPAWQVVLAVLLAQGDRGLDGQTDHRAAATVRRRHTRARRRLSPGDAIRFRRGTRRRRLRRPRCWPLRVSRRRAAITWALAALVAFSRDLHRRALPARCRGRRALRRADWRVGYGRTCMVYWGFVSGVPPRAEVAQLVEHTTENRGVGSSILPLGTTRINNLQA